ncbi:glutaminyl-peptide cyclotransferase [Maribacter polysiphoniae]|uniref:Glutamine cyclotransferase n=1 Tax=Maribacter polysiphoniae TaxID=429344 RepID=A0A316E1R5_9FLAO|nr:glutaminyl-peptide cyclotransferase [Maribacter polysiphoniae]MBD1261276.1 glutaminyl-peptide cyclotransferase [Maribacter polysiphoniae]PWK23482.1 glutamine cyclotransferase [Maribacter polysiphoniae]
MNLIKLTSFSFLLLLFMSCGSGNTKATSLFEIQLEGNKTDFKQHQTVSVGIKNKKEKSINSVTYTIDGKELEVKENKITFDLTTLGAKTLKATVDYDDTRIDVSKKIKVLAPTPPALYTYEIINEFPHDIKAYTQGLEFHDGILYESTGKKGRSSLRKVDFKTGEILKQIRLEDSQFGEGITIMNGKIYQLTWQNGIGFVYDLEKFEKIDTFQYGESKEGWGLCHNGNKIFKSDGTEKIWFLNPDTLAEEGHIETVTNKSVFNMANELEYLDGKIYANVYQKPSMMIIDAQSGAIEGVINFGGLKERVTKHQELDVLNGVAYHPERKTFFVTGKNWDKMFEVKIIKK